MNFRILAAGAALVALSAPAFAGDVPEAAPADAAVATEFTAPVAPAAPVVTPVALRANTMVPLTLNSGLTTRSTLTGTKFSMTVAQDVVSDGHVVIPKGSRAVGLVTYVKKNGSFGKSGKMELAFKYIELGGRQIPLEGSYFQEGEGNTMGTVGAVFAAGIIGGAVVKGKEVDLAAGRDFEATILQDVPFTATDGRVALDQRFSPGAVSMQTLTEKEYKAKVKAAKKAAKG